jgi:threonylcarbamoyladenosine tRNA methylthiotransferase MtaB
LLQNIEEKTGIERFRLGSLNPLEIDDKMLAFLKNSEKFCPHFHLSLQSMCDKTLKSMNRHYSVQQSLDLIEQISEIFPLPFIGSDIIAGFAGESEDDFKITAENLHKSKLTQIHTFPYSLRKGTLAENLSRHIDAKTKEQRAKIIKEISAQKHREFLQKNLNTVQEILIEKNVDRKTGFLKGVSRNYINVLIAPDADSNSLKNTIQRVKIKDVGEKVLAEIF